MHPAEIAIRTAWARIRAQVLRQDEKAAGAKGSGSNQHEVRSHNNTAPTLDDLGVSKQQSVTVNIRVVQIFIGSRIIAGLQGVGRALVPKRRGQVAVTDNLKPRLPRTPDLVLPDDTPPTRRRPRRGMIHEGYAVAHEPPGHRESVADPRISSAHFDE